MTKQFKTYLLITIVIGVWGIIGLQIFNYLNPTEINIPVAKSSQKIKQQKFKKREPYKVKNHSRDPFLGKLITTNKKTIKKRTINLQLQNFPNIVYNGIIKSGTHKSFIITVEGTQEILKIGKSIHNIKLISGNNSKIVVLFNGKKKTILLN